MAGLDSRRINTGFIHNPPVLALPALNIDILSASSHPGAIIQRPGENSPRFLICFLQTVGHSALSTVLKACLRCVYHIELIVSRAGSPHASIRGSSDRWWVYCFENSRLRTGLHRTPGVVRSRAPSHVFRPSDRFEEDSQSTSRWAPWTERQQPFGQRREYPSCRCTTSAVRLAGYLCIYLQACAGRVA